MVFFFPMLLTLFGGVAKLGVDIVNDSGGISKSYGGGPPQAPTWKTPRQVDEALKKETFYWVDKLVDAMAKFVDEPHEDVRVTLAGGGGSRYL